MTKPSRHVRSRTFGRILGVFFILGILVLLVVLTACGSSLKPGPAGKVVGKDTDTHTVHHSGHCTTSKGKTKCAAGHDTRTFTYHLTTKDPKDGATTEFEVSSGTYDDCVRGSNYSKGKCT